MRLKEGLGLFTWTPSMQHRKKITTKPSRFRISKNTLVSTSSLVVENLSIVKFDLHTRDMAPTRSKKRKSTESASSVDVQSFPAPPQMVPTKARSPKRSPTSRSPIRKPKMGITIGQKQALIDNLQLESTSPPAMYS